MAPKLQDMPPPGGYQAIQYARIPARQYFSGYSIILGYLGMTTVAMYLYSLSYKKVKCEEIELRSARLAILPLLKAERDREFLKQLRRNRDEEEELMKNVPGWEVGKWKGEPVFKTLPPDTLLTPHPAEYYCHTRQRYYAWSQNVFWWLLGSS